MSGWTDSEKLALMVSIVMSHGGGTFNWDNVKLPPGRTKKACTHIWQKARDDYREIHKNGEDLPPATPRKRRAPKKLDDVKEEDGESSTVKPAKKRRYTMDPNVTEYDESLTAGSSKKRKYAEIADSEDEYKHFDGYKMGRIKAEPEDDDNVPC